MRQTDDFAIFKRLESDFETCAAKIFLYYSQRLSLFSDKLLEARQYICAIKIICQVASHEENQFWA